MAVFRGCNAGIKTIGIDSVGNVRGCESMYDDSFIEGNVRDESLQSIWNNPDNFSYNRRFNIDNLNGACRECSHNTICRGGCRSYNYFTSGDLLTSKRCVSSINNNA